MGWLGLARFGVAAGAEGAAGFLERAFPGRHTVGQVKRDVAAVTKIPVFRQVARLGVE